MTSHVEAADLLLAANHGAHIKSMTLALSAHDGQRRRTGEPYITHPTMVAFYVYRMFPHEANWINGAILHDVLEDTAWTADDLADEVGGEVTDLVCQLSEYWGSVPLDGHQKAQLVAARMAESPLGVRVVKACDLTHNVETCGGLRNPPDFARRKSIVFEGCARSGDLPESIITQFQTAYERATP